MTERSLPALAFILIMTLCVLYGYMGGYVAAVHIECETTQVLDDNPLKEAP